MPAKTTAPNRLDSAISLSFLVLFWVLTVLMVVYALLGAIWITWLAFGRPASWWPMLGDVLRNSTGPFALLGAAISVGAVLKTSKDRGAEAASANFREQMQWAAENLSNEDAVVSAFAQEIFNKYAEEAAKTRSLLSPQDMDMALSMQDIAVRITDPNLLDFPREDEEDE